MIPHLNKYPKNIKIALDQQLMQNIKVNYGY